MRNLVKHSLAWGLGKHRSPDKHHDRLPAKAPMRRLPALAAGILLIAALSGCACRPGYVGPYGGVHPARCWVW